MEKAEEPELNEQDLACLDYDSDEFSESTVV
jgi:hypothetical protein